MVGNERRRRTFLTRAAAVAVLALALGTAVARAEAPKFSFYGVSFGMTRAEVGEKWLPLSGGVYAVSSGAIKQIRPQFDYQGRLYAFTFSLDPQLGDHPQDLVNIALQDLLNSLWNKKDAGLIVTLATGREGTQITMVDERLRDGYLTHLKGKLAEYFQP